MSPLFQTIVTAVATLGASSLGAGCAFRLNNKAHARQTERERVAAINKALFVLVRQFNTLTVIQNQIIDPTRDDPMRFVNMRPFLPISPGSPTLNLEEVSFLLETEHRNALMELLLEEERFETAIQAMNKRSRLHLEILQPKLAAAGISEGVGYTKDQIVKVLGQSFILHMQRATAEAVTHVDDAVASNLEVADRFHVAMKQLYPKHRIIKFEPLGASNAPVKEHTV